MSTVDTVIIGAGQAGLALSRLLTEAGHDHVVLERGRVGERWRSERWDSLALLTPNWANRLPYDDEPDDPDAYTSRAEFVATLQRYARSFGAPVHERTTVTAVERAGGGFHVAHRPRRMARTQRRGRHGRLRRARGAVVRRLGAGAGRAAARVSLPRAGVAGAGRRAGRRRGAERSPDRRRARARRAPRRARRRPPRAHRPSLPRPRHLGLARRARGPVPVAATDELSSRAPPPAARPAARRPAGRPNDRPRRARRGRRAHQPAASRASPARTRCSDRRARGEHRGRRRASAAACCGRIDDHIASRADAHAFPPRERVAPIQRACAAARDRPRGRERISTIVWATGFRRHFPWLRIPEVIGSDGGIRHDRGRTAVPGLFVLGMRWQSRMTSHSDRRRRRGRRVPGRADRPRRGRPPGAPRRGLTLAAMPSAYAAAVTAPCAPDARRSSSARAAATPAVACWSGSSSRTAATSDRASGRQPAAARSSASSRAACTAPAGVPMTRARSSARAKRVPRAHRRRERARGGP